MTVFFNRNESVPGNVPDDPKQEDPGMMEARLKAPEVHMCAPARFILRHGPICGRSSLHQSETSPKRENEAPVYCESANPIDSLPGAYPVAAKGRMSGFTKRTTRHVYGEVEDALAGIQGSGR
jgi:hypothetical protein